MNERIPQRIDHYRYTDKGTTLEGVITREESQKDLSRFISSIENNLSDIEYSFVFEVDVAGNRIVTGSIATRVELQCQRCMNNYELDLNCEVVIAFVHDEYGQNKAESSNYDVFWLKEKEYFDPRILIEDELILALPQIPMHPETEIGKKCQSAYSVSEDAIQPLNGKDFDLVEKDKSEQMDDDNPFAVLKQLKK